VISRLELAYLIPEESAALSTYLHLRVVVEVQDSPHLHCAVEHSHMAQKINELNPCLFSNLADTFMSLVNRYLA